MSSGLYRPAAAEYNQTRSRLLRTAQFHVLLKEKRIMSIHKISCLALLTAALGSLVPALAQAPQAPPAKPDSPEVKALIEKAKKAGGPMWAEEEHFFCEAPRANRADDPVIPASKIFDDVYVIGTSGTAVYVVQTSAGLLMIDSLGASQVETQLLPGFQ